MQGQRFNDGKRQWSLVDFDALEPMVEVLEFGAKKYAAHNWKKGLSVNQICESMLRHVYALLRGEDNDPESKISHTGHILCNAMFLSHMMANRPDMDDRYKGEVKDPNQLSLFDLAKETPNDSEFGKKVREYLNKQ